MREVRKKGRILDGNRNKKVWEVKKRENKIDPKWEILSSDSRRILDWYSNF